MKWHERHVVIGLATTVFVFCLLVALLSACNRRSTAYDHCDALGLAAYEAPARPAPRPASHPRLSLRKPAARAPRPAVHPVARPATTHHVVVHHVIHPAPKPTRHVVVHHVLHARPTHHVDVHHHYDDGMC